MLYVDALKELQDYGAHVEVSNRHLYQLIKTLEEQKEKIKKLEQENKTLQNTVSKIKYIDLKDTLTCFGTKE